MRIAQLIKQAGLIGMSYEFFFFSNKGTFELSAGGPGAADFWRDILACFGTSPVYVVTKITIRRLQVKTPQMMAMLDVFVDTYKYVFPKIFKFRDFLKRLDDGEQFFFYNSKLYLTQMEEIQLHAQLSAHAAGDSGELNFDSLIEMHRDLLMNYEIDGPSPDRKFYIGNRRKDERLCRFCGNTRAERNPVDGKVSRTTFRHEAHAISESLGNKTLILCDECDACNTHFAEGCEAHIHLYLKLFAAFFKIKNKDNRISKIKGKNFYFSYVDDGEKASIRQALEASASEMQSDDDIARDDEIDSEGTKDAIRKLEALDFRLMYWRAEGDPEYLSDQPPESIPLRHFEQINMQEIYKALVKFAMSVIEARHLPSFNRTIEWLAGSSYREVLPKVALRHSYVGFSKEPHMRVYLKRMGKQELPVAVGEFSFTFLQYVFIIPAFGDDDADCTREEIYREFWEFFPFKRLGNWDFQDFSDSRLKDFVFNMKLKNRGG
ncbi:hypothetical protein [Pseudomonas syringae]|uniref:hypothetical protein n=1 Tax=Pseudomonas syringae TaxID=317 RepID=UPI003F86A98C